MSNSMENMTDREWAREFVACRIPKTGRRFGETVAVLEEKLKAVRAQEHARLTVAELGIEKSGDSIQELLNRLAALVGCGECGLTATELMARVEDALRVRAVVAPVSSPATSPATAGGAPMLGAPTRATGTGVSVSEAEQ